MDHSCMLGLHIMVAVRILSASGALFKEPKHCREAI